MTLDDQYQYIQQRLGFELPLPYTKPWSAAPDFLAIISEYCLRNRPSNIVECSSGTSTLVLSRCCQINQRGHVSSLEDGETYAQKTRAELTRFSLQDWATVVDAPLQTQVLGQHQFQWYRLDHLAVREIDMLVIDGPPGHIQKYSRYPALPLLADRLADNCVIFLDDAARPDELQIVNSWKQQYPKFRLQRIATLRGCSVLSCHAG